MIEWWVCLSRSGPVLLRSFEAPRDPPRLGASEPYGPFTGRLRLVPLQQPHAGSVQNTHTKHTAHMCFQLLRSAIPTCPPLPSQIPFDFAGTQGLARVCSAILCTCSVRDRPCLHTSLGSCHTVFHVPNRFWRSRLCCTPYSKSLPMTTRLRSALLRICHSQCVSGASVIVSIMNAQRPASRSTSSQPGQVLEPVPCNSTRIGFVARLHPRFASTGFQLPPCVCLRVQ